MENKETSPDELKQLVQNIENVESANNNFLHDFDIAIDLGNTEEATHSKKQIESKVTDMKNFEESDFSVIIRDDEKENSDEKTVFTPNFESVQSDILLSVTKNRDLQY